MNIGQAALASGVSAKMIRHYETIGLLPKAKRSYGGYRTYDEADLHILRFIRRARDAGFSTPQIKKLLSLWEDRARPAGEIRQLARAHLAEVEAKIAELRSIARTLTDLIEICHGDDRPECPILDSLAGVTDAGQAPDCPEGSAHSSKLSLHSIRRTRHE